MKLKGFVEEDFVQYKKPSMFLGTTKCNWKCCTELGLCTDICQNSPLASSKTIVIDDVDIYKRFVENPITKAVVIGGLEPMLDIDDVIHLISTFRVNGCDCDFVIYTGYYKNEIESQLEKLSRFNNIIVKFGRYIPNKNSVYDSVLGVRLASDNQYAERLS